MRLKLAKGVPEESFHFEPKLPRLWKLPEQLTTHHADRFVRDPETFQFEIQAARLRAQFTIKYALRFTRKEGVIRSSKTPSFSI
jgi:hypothetical protein